MKPNSVYIIAWLLALPLICATDHHGSAKAQIPVPSIPNQGSLLERDILEQRLERLERLERQKQLDEAANARGDAVAGAAQTATDGVDAADQTTDSALQSVDSIANEAVELASDVVAGVARLFVPGLDPAGADIEQDIIIVLVRNDIAANTAPPGTALIARRNLPSLDMSLWTLRRTGGLTLPQAIESVRAAFPGAAVDYNHLYRLAADDNPGQGTDSVVENPTVATSSGDPKIGVIDSAIMKDHQALAEVKVISRDFAANEGHRPLTHGTAIASLVAKSAANRATIYSASIFFQVPGYAPGASAESLVEALDWLVEERVHAINMSLAGPGNMLLETALANLPEDAPVIVAAVGNNGPSGPPQYPAAYEGIIGVTAVDRDQRIFRYANRGDHVDFAALGVNRKIADSESGSWRLESGTSMASPHVAVVIAQILQKETIRKDAVRSWLIASAEDLGRRGFDRVFGHGLITRPAMVVATSE